MSILIACNLGSYGKYVEKAWTHLPSLGIHHVELGVPGRDELAVTSKKLADHGLHASSLQGQCNIQSPEAVEGMKPQLATCADLGAAICTPRVCRPLELSAHVRNLRKSPTGPTARFL